MDSTHRPDKLIRRLGLVGIIISACFLALHFISPSEAEQSILLGFSPLRLISGLPIAAGLMLAFATWLGSSQKWFEKYSQRYSILRRHPAIIKFLFDGIWLFGVVLMMTYLVDAGGMMMNYLKRLLPFSGWCIGIGILGSIGTILLSQEAGRNGRIWLLVFTVLITAAAAISYGQIFRRAYVGTEDIYYLYLDGQRLLTGENPYGRILFGSMRVNEKYATFFPGFYYLSALTQSIGLAGFEEWISFWRIIFVYAGLGIAIVLTYTTKREGLVVALTTATFWLFNRWTLGVVHSSDMDFLAIFLLLASIGLLKDHKIWAFSLFSLSLALKQMGIFLLPLYLGWAWQMRDRSRPLTSFSFSLAALAIPSLMFILPMLVWNAEAFVRSVFFSVTRDPAAFGDVFSLDVLLGWRGLIARIPLAVMLALVYWIVIKRRISAAASSMLALAVFVFFNTVFFRSYMVWLVPFLPLSAVEAINHVRQFR